MQDCLEALRFQLDAARRYDFATTSLLSFDALSFRPSLSLAGKLAGDKRHELGLHFHGYQGREFETRFGTREAAFWLLPRQIRQDLIDLMMERYCRHFGHLPKAVGCYILDAWTLTYLKRTYPSIECAISHCFEEGVKMFHGNNHNWNLFSDGGPWAPFWPSRHCALVPARDRTEAIDLVALPHLNRDMIMALTSRDDYFASHPGNLLRARINEGPHCAYMLRFIDAWRRQAELNGWSYLSIFVSSPWLLQRHWAVDRQQDVRMLYEQMLAHLAEERNAERCRVSTMSEFATEFRQTISTGDPTICHWTDVLTDSKREIVWAVNSHYRIALDMNAGGAGVDLRVYGGRLDRNLGPEADGRWNGNYPFVVSAELRGGHAQNHLAFELRHGGQRVNAIERRGSAEIDCLVVGQSWRVRFGPVTYAVGDLLVTVVSAWHITADKTLRVDREITELSDPLAEVGLYEVFKGTLGTTEYPEPVPDATLQLGEPGSSGSRSLPFRLSGSPALEGEAGEVRVALPAAGIEIRLHGGPDPRHGSVEDGTLFSPNYTLKLGRKVGIRQGLTSWLTFAPLPSTPC